jgi:transcriptional regulator with XRE-family HTH domain
VYQEIGRELRARRTASGRTVASVAAEAGLSVPYIANLENGRGNPTAAALTRLAAALGMRLVITLVPVEDGRAAAPDGIDTVLDPGRAGWPPSVPQIPTSLVRLGRTLRFRRAVDAIAASLDRDEDRDQDRDEGRDEDRDKDELARQLVPALAALAHALDRDLAEADWWRLLDALLLIAAHPAG